MNTCYYTIKDGYKNARKNKKKTQFLNYVQYIYDIHCRKFYNIRINLGLPLKIFAFKH